MPDTPNPEPIELTPEMLKGIIVALFLETANGQQIEVPPADGIKRVLVSRDGKLAWREIKR